MKRWLSLLMSVLMMVTMLPVTVVASTSACSHSYSAACDAICDWCGYDRSDLPTFDEVEVTEPTIVASNAVGRPGDTVQVTISMKNNPGIASTKVEVGYDTSALTLIGHEAGDFTAPGYSWGAVDRSPFIINWLDMRAGNVTAELLATLTFRINAGATEGAYPITLAYDNEGDIFNSNWETVYFGAQESVVYVGTLKEHTYDNACDAACNVCGTHREVKPHAYVKKVTVPGDCMTDESTTYVCSVCGDTYYETIPARGAHEYDAVCDAICNLCGYDRSQLPAYDDVTVTKPTIVVGGAAGQAGDTVQVTISMKNNPGIVSAKVKVGYDATAMTLMAYENGDFSLGGYGNGTLTAVPFVINWCDAINPDNQSELFATLTFKIHDDAAEGTYPITLTYDNEGDIFNADWETVYFDAYESAVYVSSLRDHSYAADCDAFCDVCGFERANMSEDDEVEFTEPTIVVGGAAGVPGDTVQVTISMKNNPGIVSALVKVGYDASALTLVKYQAGDFSARGYSWSVIERNPFTINWCDAAHDDNKSELLATLTFEINKGAARGAYPITLEYDCEGDFYNTAWDTIYFDAYESFVYVGMADKHTYANDCDPDCDLCGATREVEPHAYVGKVTQFATCVVDGVKTYTCSVCGDSYTVAIPATGAHDYSVDCDTVCNVCGYDRSDLPSLDEVEVTEPTIVVGGAAGKPGDTVQVTISMKNNPGIISTKVRVGYDPSALTLVKYEAGAFSASGYSWGPIGNVPFVVNWCDAVNPNNSAELLATLTFEINAAAADGVYPITLDYNANDIFDYDWSLIDFGAHESFVIVSTLKEHTYTNDCDESCNLCGAIRVVGPHAYVGAITKSATCVEDGVKTYTCSVCGDSYTEAIPATGEHTYVGAITKPATCAADGVKTYTCSVCGDSYTEAIPATGEHTYVGAITKPATCVVDGVKTYTCSVCGDSYIQAIPATGEHTYVVEVTKPATCAMDGVKTYTCSVCGHAYTETIPATGEHTYVGEITKPASCMVDGVKTYTCSVCGDSYTEVIAAIGSHTYVGEITKPATCAENGVKTYTCFVCGDSYTESIPATGDHTYVGEVTQPATCAVDGVKTYTCFVCNHSYTEAIPATGEHTYVGEVTQPATCAVDGVKTYTCSVCGDSYTETIPATGEHTYVDEITQSATCVEDGVKTDTCSVCGDSYTEAIPATGVHNYSVDCDTLCDVCGYDRSDLPTLDEVEVTKPTIVVGGTIGKPGDTVQVTISMKNNPGIISTKVRVGYDTSALTLVEYQAGDFSASGYSWGPIKNVPFVVNWCDAINPNNSAELLATLTFEINADAADGVYPITLDYNAGDIFDSDWAEIHFGTHESFVIVSTLKEHTYTNACDESCNLCDAIRVVEPHAYVGEITKPASCVVDGVKTYTCSVCGDSYTEVIPATGKHNYVGEVTQSATCAVDGVKTYTCSACGDSYTEVIPATGEHTYVGEVTQSATCAVDGVKTYTCSVCGDSYTEVIPATGIHNYVGKVTTAATCAVNGVKTYTCSVCGDSYTETIPATGEHTYVGEVTKPASCVEDGVKTYTCSTCGDSYTEVITAVGSHSYAAVCDAVCDVCGYDRSDLPTYGDVEVTEPTIVVGGVVGKPGDTVQVTIALKNNPGIVSAKVLVGYDASALTLVKYEAGNFSASGYSWGLIENAPFVVNWCDAVGGDNKAELLATLTFEIKEGAAEGEYPITLEYSCEDDFYNTAWETIEFDDVESSVYVSSLKEHTYVEEITVPATCVSDGVKTYTCSVCGDSYTEVIRANGAHSYRDDADHDCDQCGFERAMVGDPNGDGRVNNRDLGLLQQFLNNWSVDATYAAFDLNDDGRVNNRDLGLFQQYLNDWNVELK